MLLRPFLLATLIGSAAAQISFEPSQAITEAMAFGFNVAEATDMDGDGDLDLVAAEAFCVRVLWWENDGIGNFGRPHEWLGGNCHHNVIGLEDWNGDGIKDIWIADISYDGSSKIATIMVAVNDGNGSFSPPQPLEAITLDGDLSLGSPVMVDLDGDGLKDIHLPSGIIQYVRTNANLEDAPSDLPFYEDFPLLISTSADLMTFDMEDDGDLDLIATLPSHVGLGLIENLGDENYADLQVLPTFGFDSSSSDSSFRLQSTSEGNLLWQLRRDDETGVHSLLRYPITASGTLESMEQIHLPDTIQGKTIIWHTFQVISPQTLVVGGFSYSPFISHFLEIDTTANPPSIQLIHESEGVAACDLIQLADLDGDQFQDLLLPLSELPGLVASTKSRIDWLPASSGGTGFSGEAKTIMKGLSHPWIFFAGNIDGQGGAQLLVGSSRRFLYPGTGHDLLSVFTASEAGQGWTESPISLDCDAFVFVDSVDLEGNFAIDIPNSHGPKVIHCSKGRMDFLVQTFQEQGDEGRFHSSSVVRFAWLLQDDVGAFHLQPLTIEPSEGLTGALHIDWDGDGIRDLVYKKGSIYSFNAITVWRRGTGVAFGEEMHLSSSFFLLSASEARDIDWDGDQDLILTDLYNPLPGYASSWAENDGSGNISAIRGLPHSAVPVAADFDKDGHLDFFDNNGQEGILLARPNLDFEPIGNQGRRPPGTFLDLDGDGDLDQISTLPTQGLQGYSTLFWQENLGDAHFTGTSSEPPGEPLGGVRWAQRNQSLMADVDGDGTSDLVVASRNPSRLEWFKISKAPEPAAFREWIDSAEIAGHSAGPLADWDQDSITNWEEFAFGSNPTVSDAHHPGRPRLELAPGGPIYTFQSRSDASEIGIQYSKLRSEDLVEWSPWDPAGESESGEPGYRRFHFSTAPGQAAEFFKIEISDPESWAP